MYISQLLIDISNNKPYRHQVGRCWIQNLHRVHQRLGMAFDSEDRKNTDARYNPHFSAQSMFEGNTALACQPKNTHVERTEKNGFLFHVDIQTSPSIARITVLSATVPDWNYAFLNAEHILARPPLPARKLDLDIQNGSKCEFRILANPVSIKSVQVEKRVFVKEETPILDESKMDNWIRERLCGSAKILDMQINKQPTGRVNKPGNKGKQGNRGFEIYSVLFEGVLEVSDKEELLKTLVKGIGKRKAYGYGLLLLNPI